MNIRYLILFTGFLVSQWIASGQSKKEIEALASAPKKPAALRGHPEFH